MQVSSIETYLASPLGLGLFAVLFVPLWCASSLWVSWVSGWRMLARRFKYQSEPYRDIESTGSFISVYMRFWSYYGGLVLSTAADDALYVSMMFLFRIGHPPLRIPWDEIRLGRTKFFFRTFIVLTLGNEEKVPMRILLRTARNLGILERCPQ